MRILVVGSGGVGDAVARIAARRRFFERLVVADVDLGRAQRTVEAASAHDVVGDRFVAAVVDASSADAVEALVREHGATHVLNAVDPRFVLPIFEGVRAAGAHYLDMAMSLSHAHPERPYELPGVKLGDEQFAQTAGWADAGQLALVGIGVEPGLSDVFARYAADHLFSAIDELGRARRRQPRGARRRRRADLRALVLHLDHDRGVPQPAGDLVGRSGGGGRGARGRLVHGRPVPRARGLPVPGADRRRRVRARRARGGAPHAPLGGRPEGDVQVRAGRGVHRRAADAAPPRASTGPSR